MIRHIQALSTAASILLITTGLQLGAPVVRAQQAAPIVAVPQAELLLALIRSSMAALDHGNKTGNYSVLRELAGPAMQANSTGQISAMFAQIRASQVDLVPTLVVTPQLTEAPVVNPHGLLQLAGFFPTRPHQISFQMIFQPLSGQWRLQGISVGLQLVEAPAMATGGSAPSQQAAPAKQKAVAPPAAGGADKGAKSEAPSTRAK